MTFRTRGDNLTSHAAPNGRTTGDAGTAAVHLTVRLDDDQLGLLAGLVAAALREPTVPDDVWLDSRAAADHLGLHRDTLRKLAAEGSVPSEQDAPGCKRFYRRSDLDQWRASGGRSNGFHGASIPLR